MFRTHEVRREEELTERLWEMSVPRENGETDRRQALLPVWWPGRFDEVSRLRTEHTGI